MTSTNNTTKAVIRFLECNGFVAWRQNNGAVWHPRRNAFMKNPMHKRGIPDIIFYRKRDSRIGFCEIKTGKDKLSMWQENFLNEARKHNCLVLVVKDVDDFLEQFKTIE